MSAATVMPGGSATAAPDGIRTDIQGLRAVAVLLVVLYHAGVPVLPGGYVGVDVFFVISGFLITTHLLASLDTGGIRFAQFYARRVRRILPASMVILLLTVVAALVWMPPLQLQQMFEGAIATALYVPNVLFAYQGTDYLAETVPSVFQHYWSLGVEEQFYVFWPALLAVGFWMFRRSYRGLLAFIAGFVIASFVLGLVVTEISQPWAFFLLPTRAWELGVGGLVAFLVRSRPAWVHARWAAAPAWAGLLGLLVAAIAFSAATPFPGIAAALPVVSAAAVIAFGASRPIWGPTRVLSIRPMVFVGGISYSLYLVHWPIQIIPQSAAGWANPLPLWVTLLLGAVSIPLAYLAFRFVEQPFRAPSSSGQRPQSVLLTAAATSLAVALASLGGNAWSGQRPLSTTDVAVTTHLVSSPVASTFVPVNVVPELQAVETDNPSIYANGCHLTGLQSEVTACEFGVNRVAPTVVLFGDSHAAQWFPALDRLATSGEINLVVNTKGSCPSAAIISPHARAEDRSCETWRGSVMERLAVDPPDVVVLANYTSAHLDGIPEDPETTWKEGLIRTIEALPDSTRVVVMADTPFMVATPAICLSAHLSDADTCARDRTDAIDDRASGLDRIAAEVTGAEFADVNDYLCSNVCPAIIGNTVVYRDAHHLTASFSRILSPVFEQLLGLEP